MRTVELSQTLGRLDGAAVKCGGFVRLATTVLEHLGISHRVIQGSVTGPDGRIPYHFWIEVDGLICEYRARMWLGPDAPPGVEPESPLIEFDVKTNFPTHDKSSSPVTIKSTQKEKLAAAASCCNVNALRGQLPMPENNSTNATGGLPRSRGRAH